MKKKSSRWTRLFYSKRGHLVLFVGVFALIGGFFLYQSFAENAAFSFSGVLTTTVKEKSHTVNSPGKGNLTASLTWPRTKQQLRFRIYGPNNVILAEKTGYSPLNVSIPVQASTYRLQVQGVVNENTKYVIKGTINTVAPSDTSPPSQVTNLQGKATSTTNIDLSWTASIDNVAIKNYKVYRDGVLAKTLTATKVSDGSRTAGKTYAYTVIAYDTAGNPSPVSNTVNVTTPVGTTTPPPPTVTPPPSPPTTTPPPPTPAGMPAYTSYSSITGPLTNPASMPNQKTGLYIISQPGTYSGIYVKNGNIEIRANDVVLTDFVIDNSAGYQGTGNLVRVYPGFARQEISHGRLIGYQGYGWGVYPVKDTYIHHLDISQTGDGLQVGINGRIEYTWVHNLHPGAAGLGHVDAIQLVGGREGNTQIAYNRLDGPYKNQTSAIIVKSDLGDINGLDIHDNYLSGGAYTLYVYDFAGHHVTNVKIDRNQFMRGSYLYGPTATLPTTNHPGIISKSGNTYDDGSALAIP